MRKHSIYSDPAPKRKRPRIYASGDSPGGKPCPTCYAQMILEGKTQWMCAKHGEPAKP